MRVTSMKNASALQSSASQASAQQPEDVPEKVIKVNKKHFIEENDCR